MDKFQKISEVLHYIEEHLGDIADYEQVAERFCFSPYYFHRLFSAVVGIFANVGWQEPQNCSQILIRQ